MRRVQIAVAVASALIVVALGITLASAPISVAGMNSAARRLEPFLVIGKRIRACQQGEVLPRGTTAVRMHVLAEIGPRVKVQLLQGAQTIAHGETAPWWGGNAVTVPVNALTTTRSGVTLCFELQLVSDEQIDLSGEVTKGARSAHVGSKALRGRLAVEYLHRSSSSFLSLAPQIARRIGLGRGGAGTWIMLPIAAAMAAVMALSLRLLLRDLR
jgi:hypothetical protein